MPSAGAAHAPSPLLTIEPASALDEPVDIRLTGLVPGARVTLTATMTDHLDRRWQSEATFTADDAGVVDVATQAPIAGSYDGVEPMGLLVHDSGGPRRFIPALPPLSPRRRARGGRGGTDDRRGARGAKTSRLRCDR